MAAVDTFGHVGLSAVCAVTPALMVAVGLYQDTRCGQSSHRAQIIDHTHGNESRVCRP
jgi:hypothetical protein